MQRILIIFLLLLFFSKNIFGFVSHEGHFTIWMPSEPRLEEKTHKSFVGNIIEKTFVAKSNGQEFLVSYSELPSIAVVMQSTKALLNRSKDGFLQESGAEELSFNKFTLGDKEGRELSFRIVNKNHVIDAIGKARFFLYNKTMYVWIITITNYDHYSENHVMQEFLNSFKIL